MDCFVAGIVKGLVEQQNACVHFGSLMAFRAHLQKAQSAGLVQDEHTLTALGRAYYDQQSLSDLPKCRSYVWPSRDWSVGLPKPCDPQS